MALPELTNDQRRQLIDTQQLFAAWRPLQLEKLERPRLYWNTSKGVRYLYAKRAGVPTPLGRETPELLQQKTEHDARGRVLKNQLSQLTARLDTMAPINRAMRLGRLPTLPGRVLRQLDYRSLLGEHIIVAGTNALYAYEAAAGVVIGGDLLATGDADFLWDTRRALELVGNAIRHEGLMGILRDIDPTFEAHYGYNASNSDGYIVDLISPIDEGLPTTLGAGPDLEATQMEGAQWLLDSPRFDDVIVAGDGLPLRIVAPEPRTFALHKLWLSRLDSRQPLKRPRDRDQAIVVAEIARTHLGRRLDIREMPWLPRELALLVPELLQASA